MCIVHRICGNTVVSYVETTTPNGSVRPYYTGIDQKKPIGRRESFTERLRRAEISRLTGASHRSDGLELHQLSPQSSAIIEPIRFENDWYEDRRPRSHGPRGRNDRYKTNRHSRPTVW